jgi:tRNA(Ile)-lysidine synthetase-like protein
MADMEPDLQPGRYVVAVSGGVDSVVLLHMLARNPELQLTVAHYDHGIREDSAEDRRLVQELAREYGLPFVYHAGKLGPGTSEATARTARYGFLHNVRQVSGAGAIITAHHQDDVLETIILNLLRGTGRRGLASLRSTDIVKRPLLHVPKKELLRYAEREGLRWHEDSTNTDEKYLRNYVRKYILPRFADADREALLEISRQTHALNMQITEQAVNFLHVQPARHVLDRHGFIMLPHAVAREIMAEWLLQNTGVELSRKMLERLVMAAKTGRADSRVDVSAGHWLYISRTRLALQPLER